MFEAVNSGWMDLGSRIEHVAGTTSPRCLRGSSERRHGVGPRISDEMRLSDLLRKFAAFGALIRKG